MICRQILTLVWLFSFMLITWLPVFIFRFQQNLIRKEVKLIIKNGVPEDQRIRFYADELEADKSNLTWIHEHEFRYNGEMYDILKREYINGELVYVCIHDVKESGLFRNLEELIDRQMQHHSPLGKQIRQLISFFECLNVWKPAGLIYFQEETELLGMPFYISICLFHSLPDTPPPELCIG